MKAIHEKKITENFVRKNNLSIDEMNAEAQRVFETLPETDPKTKEPVSEDTRWARAYRRVRGAFRKKAKTMANSAEGMIVCRMSNKAFERNQYDYAMRTMIKHGKDTAISKGLMNKEGEPIYVWGDKKGQVILNEDDKPGRPQASGRAIGYTFSRNEEGEVSDVESRYIVIPKKNVDDNIPICQVGRLAINITDKKQNGFPFADNNFAYYNDSSVSAIVRPPYGAEEVNDILHQWNEAFGDNFEIISNSTELVTFSKEHSYSTDNKKAEYDFCVVAGTVMDISASTFGEYGEDSVMIEFVDYDTFETATLYIYVPSEMLQGLCMEIDDQGIFVLQVSEGKDSNGNPKPRWHLGGFLQIDDDVDIEEFFGISLEDDDV